MIKDSGERRKFEADANGNYAVRDMSAGKGRFDLVPLDTIGSLYNDEFIWEIESEEYESAFFIAVSEFFGGARYTALLEIAKHFENGAIKYKPNNWRSGKGIPKESYIDSAVRHYVKAKAGWKDEPHATACLWNLICLIWSIQNIYEGEQKSESKCQNCVYFGINPKSEWYLKCCLDKCAFKEGKQNEQNI